MHLIYHTIVKTFYAAGFMEMHYNHNKKRKMNIKYYSRHSLPYRQTSADKPRLSSSIGERKVRHINLSVLQQSAVLQVSCSQPDLFSLIHFLTQNPEEAEVRLRSYSYSSPKAKPSRPLLNRDATITDLAEGEWTLTPFALWPLCSQEPAEWTHVPHV